MGFVPTAIMPPGTVHPVIPRRGLEKAFARIAASRLTTVCGPAGSGKSVAMLQWADAFRESKRPVMWLSVRAGVADLDSFRSTIAAAATAAGLGSVDFSGHAASAGQGRPVLIVDDAHLLSPASLDYLAQLVALSRDGLTTMISARGTAPIPVARMRGSGTLVEIAYPQLCLSAAEAAQLVTRMVGRPVDSRDLQRIVVETGGWPAGVIIASDLYRESRSPDSAWNADPEVEAYFHEEVLANQPQSIRDFLIDTAVLTDLTPGACVAVTESQHSLALLDLAHDAGLFLTASRGKPVRYSYHPLFRRLISEWLAAKFPARFAELHRRASRYFAARQHYLEALDHAALAQDQEFLADQLDRLSEPVTYMGQIQRIQEMAANIPWAILSSRPMLLLALAWPRIRRLDFAAAERMIAAAEKCLAALVEHQKADSYDCDQLANLIQHRRIMLEAGRDNMPMVEREAEALLIRLGDNHAYLSCALLAQLMAARRELYHFHDMLKLEAETRKALGRPGSSFASIALKASVAPTLMVQGKTGMARAFLEEALALAQSLQGERSGLAALPALPLAELLYQCGELDAASDLIDRHLGAVREFGFVDQLASGYIVRARLASARGDMAVALAGLEEAHLVAIECGLPRLRAFVVAEQVRLLLKTGQVEQAASAFAAGDPQIDDEPVPTLTPTRSSESLAIAWIRLEMHRHRLVRARKVASRWLDFVKRSGAVRSAVTFQLLLAQISVLNGNRPEARRSLRMAVDMAEPAGWTRIFIDEGEVIESLMLEAYAEGPLIEDATDRFAARLVAMMGGSPVLEANEHGLGSKLAPRELEILRMVHGGLRNKEIGDRLGLTEGTVKWYLQQIYDKLGVRRRPQAVLRARQLGILA